MSPILLTDVVVKNALPGPKLRKLTDGAGLYLEIKPSGRKTWRFRYARNGTERTLTFGAYPEVSLKKAREKAFEVRSQLGAGEEPSVSSTAPASAASSPAVETFESVTREWHARQAHIWVKGHADKIIRRFELYLFPWIGPKPIAAIIAPDILTCLRRVEEKGSVETAHRALQTCGQVFRYAVATGRRENNPAADLLGALMPSRETHRPAILDKAGISALLRAIDEYPGAAVTRFAMVFGLLTFVRPGELRHAEWAEISTADAEWRIPGEKMKMRDPHIVPLARQVLELLKELRPLTGEGRYLFPSPRAASRPLSDVAILAAIRRMGYAKDEMCGHGFRAMASTLLNEAGWPEDVIERQLAHRERNKVRAAYNRAQLLPARRKMMQAWADHLDDLRSGKLDAVLKSKSPQG